MHMAAINQAADASVIDESLLGFKRAEDGIYHFAKRWLKSQTAQQHQQSLGGSQLQDSQQITVLQFFKPKIKSGELNEREHRA